MTTEEQLALEALILTLLRGYPSSQAAVSRGLIDSYVSTLSAYKPESVQKACDMYAHGRVDGADHRFAPSAPEIAKIAAMFDGLDKPSELPPIAVENVPQGYKLTPDGRHLIVYQGQKMPSGFVADGLLEVDFGHGKIDLRGMSPAERDYVMEHKRLPPQLGEQKQVGFVPRFQRA